MSSFLLDTHTFLWFVFDDPRISTKAVEHIEDQDNLMHLSVVSLWEIVIKSQLGKLELGISIDDFFQQNCVATDLELIDVQLPHLLAYDKLPLHHRDPFDRLLIAQAKVLEIPIISADRKLDFYEIDVIW